MQKHVVFWYVGEKIKGKGRWEVFSKKSRGWRAARWHETDLLEGTSGDTVWNRVTSHFFCLLQYHLWKQWIQLLNSLTWQKLSKLICTLWFTVKTQIVFQYPKALLYQIDGYLNILSLSHFSAVLSPHFSLTNTKILQWFWRALLMQQKEIMVLWVFLIQTE